MRLTSLFTAACLALTLQGCATTSGTSKLDAELSAIANNPQAPLASLSALAIRDGKIVYQFQSGFRTLDPVRPANAETLYRIASISKLVTSIGVMKLVEEGKLNLDADVSSYLGWQLRNPNFPDKPIKLRMLMSHTSSLRDDAGYNFGYRIALKDILQPGGSQYAKDAWSAKEAPGYFNYVNLNWGVIGQVMERASGERFDLLMQRLVLNPLGLHGGYYSAALSPQDLANLATIYRKRETDGQERWDPAGPWIAQTDDHSKTPPAVRAGADYVIGTNGTVMGPQGSLRISARGLGTIMVMLLNRGQHEGKAFLQPASIDTMFARQWTNEGRNGNNYKGFFNAWGLGNQHFLNISGPGSGDRQVEDGGFSGKGHTGDAYGLTSAFALDFERRAGMIFMVGGPGFNPETTPGKYSGKFRYEEQILDALYRHAIKGQ